MTAGAIGTRDAIERLREELAGRPPEERTRLVAALDRQLQADRDRVAAGRTASMTTVALIEWAVERVLIVDQSTAGDVAIFTPDMKHRLALTRRVMPTDGDATVGRVLVGCGLNPSTADAWKDDQTIRKGKGFAARWGCDLYIMLNAHDYRATDPADMKRAGKNGVQVVSEHNDALIAFVLDHLEPHDIALAAWGGHASPERGATMTTLATVAGVKWRCFGYNLNGSPQHPLYQPWVTPLVDYPRSAP